MSELKIGDKVRCTRTGVIGVVVGFIEMVGGLNLPPAVMVETDPETKRGVVREPAALERVQVS